MPAGASDTSPSFAGTGRELKRGETDDALASRSAADTRRDMERLRDAKPKRARDFNPESIIGTDQRKRVTPTTKYPARATALILFTASGGGDFLCTGWFISKDTVATAGHCIAEGGTLNPQDSYAIYPGRNGPNAADSPYGSCGATRLYTNQTWLDTEADDYDYGVIKLDCTIGKTVGWYGFTRNAIPDDTRLTVQGYPGDKTGAVQFTQWKSSDRIRAQDARRIFYKADTFGGESGAPVWIPQGACDPCGIAIHAYGNGGPEEPFTSNNHGTKINAGVFKHLKAWINQ
jgi:glutamyl endopeptidase